MVGITLQLYDHGEAVGRKGSCCAGQDIQDARRVADTLKIPHYVLDYEARFAKAVMGAFADSYLQGETPVPCVACNQKIKFRDLLGDGRRARGGGARDRPLCQEQAWQLPGGSFTAPPTRSATRAISCSPPRPSSSPSCAFRSATATRRRRASSRAISGSPVAEKSDSQDICFVPTGRYTQVIERLRPGAAEAGNIVHIDGRVLGRHGGIINYTIGQRRGLGVPAQEPLYVLKLDASRREVVVGPKECLRTRRIALRDVNWLGDEPLAAFAQSGDEVLARIRSSGALQPARVSFEDGETIVDLAYGEEGVSPGQACVFYAASDGGERLLGGGWIKSAEGGRVVGQGRLSGGRFDAAPERRWRPGRVRAASNSALQR